MLRKDTIDELDKETEDEGVRRIEAIFFVSGRFLGMKDLIAFSDFNPITIREIIQRLKSEYEKRGSALQLIQKGEGDGVMWKMDVRPEYTHIINKIATGSSEFSRAEQETLAIIAFKQPIKQSVIIKIRGNKAYDHVKKFTDLDLIRKKRVGHTWELRLSDEFYDYFNVSDGNIQEKMKAEGA